MLDRNKIKRIIKAVLLLGDKHLIETKPLSYYNASKLDVETIFIALEEELGVKLDEDVSPELTFETIANHIEDVLKSAS